jgi:hypothetical protein
MNGALLGDTMRKSFGWIRDGVGVAYRIVCEGAAAYLHCPWSPPQKRKYVTAICAVRDDSR